MSKIKKISERTYKFIVTWLKKSQVKYHNSYEIAVVGFFVAWFYLLKCFVRIFFYEWI